MDELNALFHEQMKLCLAKFFEPFTCDFLFSSPEPNCPHPASMNEHTLPTSATFQVAGGGAG